jgi:phosphoribosyl 1,2-cyclic phosphodiesterase
MRLSFWGVRGSIPVPQRAAAGYGGNTSCVAVSLSDGTTVVLDAGTGIRPLGLTMPDPDRPVHILLTHLHLDHIQGLLLFAPLFQPDLPVTIWGPAAPPGLSLERRIARYFSAPLTPLEIRELPCCLEFRDCPSTPWNIGPAEIHAEGVTHRGPTLGFRIADGDSTLAYISDHEPAIIGDIDTLEPEWLSGYALARDADLLLHDTQYTDEEYPAHVGWGHSSLTHTLQFARRVGARNTLLFHHDPWHTDDFLDGMLSEARTRWAAAGCPGTIGIAAEGVSMDVGARAHAGA